MSKVSRQSMFPTFLADAWAFNAVQQYVANLIKGKVLVGHGIWNDLSGETSFDSSTSTFL